LQHHHTPDVPHIWGPLPCGVKRPSGLELTRRRAECARGARAVARRLTDSQTSSMGRAVFTRPIPQPGRRGRRRGRGRRPPALGRWRRRFCSLASSRSSLSPTSRNTRSTAAPRPTVISAMASTSPVNPPTRTAQIAPATTSAAADPNARTRWRGATTPRYRFRSGALGTRVPLVTAQRINVTNRDPERDNHAVCSGPGGLAGRCGGGQ
jgi:hypothetical protein